MPDETSSDRELRQSTARVLREGEAGRARTDVDRATLRRVLALPVDDDLAAELDAIEEPLDDS